MNKLRQMFDETHEVIGWFGMLAILIAYFSVSREILLPSSGLFQLLNAVGAAALIYTSFKTKSWPVAVLNIVWLLIALVSLY